MTLAARTKVKPPTSVSATYSVATGNVLVAKIGWTRAVSAWPNSYDVLYRDDVELVSGITATNYRDEDVIPGFDYDYTVATVNVNEIEGPVGASVGVEMPSLPVWQIGWSLSIDQNTTSSVAARASDPDSGSLTFSRVGGTAPVTVTISSAGVVTVGLTAGGAYTLILRASNGILTADITVNLTVNVVSTAPGTPINFAANVISTSQINLTWQQAPTGQAPTSYELDRSLTGTGGWTNISSVLTTSFNDTGRSPGTQYFYRLRAISSGIPSNYATANATTTFASNATFIIPAGNDGPLASITFDGNATSHSNVAGPSRAVLPGDIIEFAAGVHGERRLQDVIGSSSNRIRVRNSSTGQVIFRRKAVMSGGFATQVPNCRHIDWIGDNCPTAPTHPTLGFVMGFKWTYAEDSVQGGTNSQKDGNTCFLKYQDLTEHITLSHFEIDGGYDPDPDLSFSLDVGIIGIQAHDHGVTMAANQGRFQKNVKFLNFYIRRCAGEGIYFGPNFANGTIPIENSEVANFLVEDCGGDGVNCKCHWQGDNSVHDGIVRRCCLDHNPAGTPGAVSILTSKMDVYNILSEDNGNPAGPAGNGSGVKLFIQNGPTLGSSPSGYPDYSTFAINAWNIVSRRNNNAGVTCSGTSGSVRPLFKAYNITAVDNLGTGVAASSQTANGGFIRNCIALSNGSQITAAGGTTASNNQTTGSPPGIFADYPGDDFSLSLAQLAVGIIGTDIAATDIDGVTRVSGSADKGAYEFAP